METGWKREGSWAPLSRLVDGTDAEDHIVRRHGHGNLRDRAHGVVKLPVRH